MSTKFYKINHSITLSKESIYTKWSLNSIVIVNFPYIYNGLNCGVGKNSKASKIRPLIGFETRPHEASKIARGGIFRDSFSNWYFHILQCPHFNLFLKTQQLKEISVKKQACKILKLILLTSNPNNQKKYMCNIDKAHLCS